MDEFEKTIRTTLSDTDKFDAAKAENLRKEIVQMFEDKLKKVYRYAWLYLIICVAAGGVAGACFGVSASLGQYVGNDCFSRHIYGCWAKHGDNKTVVLDNEQ